MLESNGETAEFSAELAQLMKDGHDIHKSIRSVDPAYDGLTKSYSEAGIDERIKKWVERARTLGKKFEAETVTITANIPWGLSVGIGFKL